MSNQTGPIFHLGKLNVESNVPIAIIEELFIKNGLSFDTFNVYHLIDKNKRAITVFDYPVEMDLNTYKEFILKVQGNLDILSKYYSDQSIIEIIKTL